MQKTLNRAKIAESLTELAEAGCPLDISVADTEDQHGDVEINQVGESMVFELPYGGTGYILDLEFINQTSKTIYCSDPLELRIQWKDPLFGWLADPRETPRTYSYFRRKRNGHRELVHAISESYYFYGGSQLEYSRELVLNHILLKRGILAPGRPLRGLLLANGGPMPNELRHGQWVEPTLSLISSKHIEYTAPVRLWVDRTEAKPKPARKYSLYGEPVGNVGLSEATRIEHVVARDFAVESATSGPGHSAAPKQSWKEKGTQSGERKSEQQPSVVRYGHDAAIHQ